MQDNFYTEISAIWGFILRFMINFTAENANANNIFTAVVITIIGAFLLQTNDGVLADGSSICVLDLLSANIFVNISSYIKTFTEFTYRELPAILLLSILKINLIFFNWTIEKIFLGA